MLSSFIGSDGNRTLNSKNSPDSSELLSYKPETELDRTRLVDLLAELQDLLEQYAPAWYTEEHHEKAIAALQPLRKR
jgi:hypothetical protein